MPSPKAITTKISATSRVAVKIKDNFYTIEYSEERSVPDDENVDMRLERDCLFNDVNNIVDKQVDEILETFKK